MFTSATPDAASMMHMVPLIPTCGEEAGHHVVACRRLAPDTCKVLDQELGHKVEAQHGDGDGGAAGQAGDDAPVDLRARGQRSWSAWLPAVMAAGQVLGRCW